MKKLIAFLIAGGLFVIALPASAIVYKNPAHRFDQDTKAIGFSLASTTMEFESEASTTTTDVDISLASFNFTLAIADGGVLGFHGGPIFIDPEGGEDIGGLQAGISYRHNLIPEGEGFQMGFLVSFRIGYASGDNSEADFSQLDGGFGGAFGVSDKAKLYALAVFTMTDVADTQYGVIQDVTTDLENANQVGVVIGFEFQSSDTMSIGLEAHAGNESGAVIYMDFLL